MSLDISSPAAPAKFEAVHLDFESGTLDGWSCKRLAGPHSAVIQSDVVRQGRFACRFELRPEDYVSQGHRAELRDLYNARWDAELWYGFSSYLSEDHHVSGDIACVIAQWHDQAKLGDPSGKPPIALRYRDGRLRVTGAYGREASSKPDIRYEFASLADFRPGVWHDFVFRVLWSRHSDSEIEVWHDGQRLVSWAGPLAYENEVEGPYFKFGAYWSPPGKSACVVYQDNYSRGHSYAEVDPSVSHKVTPSPP